MRIGLDIDNTICNTEELYNELADIYMKEKDISLEEFNSNYIEDFYINNIYSIIRDNVLKKDFYDVYSKLSKNNEIIFITARSDTFIPGFDRMTEETLSWLLRNNISYDKYYGSCYKEGKALACLREKVDIMIDDDFNNYLAFKDKGIKTLLFDDKGRHMDILDRVESWKDIERIIND